MLILIVLLKISIKLRIKMQQTFGVNINKQTDIIQKYFQ